MINGHETKQEGDGSTEVAVGDRDGRVIWQFQRSVSWVALDPQNAFHIAEATARSAHKARFGTEPPSDGSYIVQQVRSRVTEDLRNRMVQRAILMMASMERQHRNPKYIAMQVVDAILSEVG